jgi:hypothetical protein
VSGTKVEASVHKGQRRRISLPGPQAGRWLELGGRSLISGGAITKGHATEASLMTEDKPEPVRRGWEAMRRPVANLADPAQAWRLDLQCAGSCLVQRLVVWSQSIVGTRWAWRL